MEQINYYYYFVPSVISFSCSVLLLLKQIFVDHNPLNKQFAPMNMLMAIADIIQCGSSFNKKMIDDSNACKIAIYMFQIGSLQKMIFAAFFVYLVIICNVIHF